MSTTNKSNFNANNSSDEQKLYARVEREYEAAKKRTEELTSEYQRLMSEIIQLDPEVALQAISRVEADIKKRHVKWEANVRSLGLENLFGLA